VRFRAPLRSAAVAAVALVTAGCGGSGEPRPDLLAVSTRDGDYAIYAMDSGGARQTRLTEEVGNPSTPTGLFFQIEPSWSPDGRLIAFASKRAGSFDLFVMNADGTGARPITSTKEDDGHPTWSPDGTRIAFSRGAAGALYVTSADGSGVKRVTSDTASESHPAWSPDGRFIAYVRRAPGTEMREIWLVRPDGSGRRQLTALDAVSYSPTWSPDGMHVAFSTDNRITQFDIYVVTVADGETTRLTATPDDSFEPAWSPDGATIVFAEGGALYEIAMGDGSTDSADRITDSEGNDSSPAWNPVLHEEED
jgi:TolB protein